MMEFLYHVNPAIIRVLRVWYQGVQIVLLVMLAKIDIWYLMPILIREPVIVKLHTWMME